MVPPSTMSSRMRTPSRSLRGAGCRPGAADPLGLVVRPACPDLKASAEATLASEISLVEHLEQQLELATRDPGERLIGRHLIDAIDESGHCSASIEEIAGRLGAAPDRVEGVLAMIHTFDPPGSGRGVSAGVSRDPAPRPQPARPRHGGAARPSRPRRKARSAGLAPPVGRRRGRRRNARRGPCARSEAGPGLLGRHLWKCSCPTWSCGPLRRNPDRRVQPPTPRPGCS